MAKEIGICGTVEALNAFRRGLKLPRPGNGPRYVYSTHFVVHFDTVGTNATTRAYAESTSKYAEYSWAKQIDTLGWIAPPPDGSAGGDSRYDIYILNLPPGVLGITFPENLYPNPYPQGATSYIEIDNDIPSWASWAYFRVAVAHEFNHASQFRYSYAELNFWYENTATWMSDVCYDNENCYVDYLSTSPNPLTNPNRSIMDSTNFYWYAGALWPMLLHEGYNIACPRQAWERMGTISGENTLSGIDWALSNYYSANLANALKKYGVWRYFTGTRADPTYHFAESNLWPTSTLLATHSSYPVSGNQGSMNPSGPGGTDFIRFNPGTGVLNITFDGQDGYNWGAYAIGYRVPSQSIEQEISLNANGYGTTSMAWSGNSHIALVPIVTHWTGTANNLTFTYQATQVANDVGVTQIIAPTGTIDSGTVVIPQARVKNFGSNPASFPVTFRIGTFYSNTQNVNNLPAGESTLVSFTNWVAVQRGTHNTKCTTALAGDQNPSNDAMSGSVLVRVRDVGVVQIVTPTGIIDSTAQIFPQVQVKNYGTNTETFNVTFRIFGTPYNQTRAKTLNPGIQDTVNFPGWTPIRGSYTTRCTVYLAGDVNRVNDTLNGSFTVQVSDVGVTQIITPLGTIDSGTVVIPQARVKNFGTITASFPVTFRIGTFYSNTQNVSNLGAGESLLVTFSSWIALPRGTYATKCTTALVGDLNPNNNALSGSVTVRVLDVSCLSILAPTGTIDSGTVVTPVAQVRNNGTDSVTFSVIFRIGGFYNNTRSKSLNPGVTDTVGFTPWNANQIGTHLTKCTTALNGDLVQVNDAYVDSVTVQVGVLADVGVTRIIAPIGAIDSGTTLNPQAVVKNFGNTPQSFPVTFRIGTFYSNTQNVNNLPAGESTLVSFTNWTAIPRGTYTTKCSTALNGDMNPTNDALTGLVTIQVNDVGVTQIIAPSGADDSGSIVTPQVRVKNFGTITASFPVTFRIGTFYNNIQPVNNLNPSDSIIISFEPCTLLISGYHNISCSTALTNDINSTNDILIDSILVFTKDVGVLQILAPTGTIGSGTPVTPQVRIINNGVYTETFSVHFRIIATTDTIYSDDTLVTFEPHQESIIDFIPWVPIPGSFNTFVQTKLTFDQIPDNDYAFSNFSVNEIGWQRMADVPVNPSGKLPKNGSCITGLNSKIYLLKANNTPDFYYFTPNSGTGTWIQLTSLPLGSDGKNPKKGAAITGHNNIIYVLRGNNTAGFWAYDINTGWASLKNIPTGAKNPKGGSGLTYVNRAGENCIFAMKGSKTSEFYIYSIDAKTWLQVASPPTGASGKAGYKDGSCLAYDGDSFVYVLKANYGDFFRYNLLRNNWTELRRLDPAVFLNRENRKRKVKDGAGLVYLDGAIYLLKGGNTLEFWRYNINTNNWSQMNPANIWDIPIGSGKKVKSGGSFCILDNNFYVLKGNNTPEFYRHYPPAIPLPLNSNDKEGITAASFGDKNSEFTISNPTNQVIRVSYNLPKPEVVNIKLFASNGSLIKTNKLSICSGSGTIFLNTNDLTSGVYILTLNSADFKVIRKIVLTK